MMSLVDSNLWDNFLRAIKTNLQGESFETWFNPIRFEGIDKAQRLIRLRAPNQVVRDWVRVNYANLMDQSFGELRLVGYSVDWLLPEDTSKAVAAPLPSQHTSAPQPNLQSQTALETRSATQQSSGTSVAPARQVAFDPGLISKYTV